MSEFRKGQLVAVRDADDCEWRLRIYDHERGGQHFCLDPEHELSQAMWWAQICPAEFVWPNIFLVVDREIAGALRSQRDLHCQQVSWLERQLSQKIGPPKTWDWKCRHDCAWAGKKMLTYGDACAACWEQASLKAVKDVRGNEQG